MKEHIDEMTKVLVDYTEKNHIMASHVILEDYAEQLYNAGYRKQVVDANSATTKTEVAREIFEEIEAIKCVGLLPSSWVTQFAELKKKYTEEQNDT